MSGLALQGLAGLGSSEVFVSEQPLTNLEVIRSMRPGRFFPAVALFSATLPCLAAGHARRGPTAPHILRKHTSHTASHPLSQRSIDDARASEIQTALVGAGYLSGQPSGRWDGDTEAAMQRYQADHGWQTKLMPDSRAIIKLGLGPKQTTTAELQSFAGTGLTADTK